MISKSDYYSFYVKIGFLRVFICRPIRQHIQSQFHQIDKLDGYVLRACVTLLESWPGRTFGNVAACDLHDMCTVSI